MENKDVLQIAVETKSKMQQLEALRQKKEMKAFASRQRLNDNRPYYLKYRWLYILLLIVGVGANIVSGTTESSKIFAFVFPFLSFTGSQKLLSWGITIFVICVLELLNRLLAKSYFKDFVDFGGHREDMNFKMGGMIILSTISLCLSLYGGFDLIKLTENKPKELQAVLLKVEDIEQAYTPLLSEIKSDITEYKSTRQWKGRLSDDSAGKWEKMKSEKQEVMVTKADAIANLSMANTKEKERVDKLNQDALDAYYAKVEDRGFGMVWVTIFALFVLYFSLYYEEYYEKEKKSYLDKYKPVFENAVIPGSNEEYNDQKLKELEIELAKKNQEIEHLKNQNSTPLLPQENLMQLLLSGLQNIQPSIVGVPQKAIGFQSDTERQKVAPKKMDKNPTKTLVAQGLNHNLESKLSTNNTDENPSIIHKETTKIINNDIVGLKRKISTYYPRCFQKTKRHPDGASKTETVALNIEKVKGWIDELEEFGIGCKISFSKYKSKSYYAMKKVC